VQLPTATKTRATFTPLPENATPTPTLPPTFTPQPPPPFFVEEFEAPTNYWNTLYAAGDPDSVKLHYQDENLMFELTDSQTWLYAIFNVHEYQTVHIETQATSSGSEVNYMGLVCHYGEQTGWYEFNISSDGTVALLYGKWLADGIARYTPIRRETSDRIARGQDFNEFGMDCYDNVVQIYINGKIIRKLDVSRFGLTGGKVGITAASFDDLPVILSFNWLKISEP